MAISRPSSTSSSSSKSRSTAQSSSGRSSTASQQVSTHVSSKGSSSKALSKFNNASEERSPWSQPPGPTESFSKVSDVVDVYFVELTCSSTFTLVEQVSPGNSDVYSQLTANSAAVVTENSEVPPAVNWDEEIVQLIYPKSVSSTATVTDGFVPGVSYPLAFLTASSDASLTEGILLQHQTLLLA